MTRAQTYISATLTVLSGIAVYCFFAFKYPYHLHFQEQYQLFESTWAYFGSVAAVPGGLADWLGRFLTQFCYHAPVGAALMTLLVITVQLLTWAVCRRHTFVSYALSFLPAIASLAFLCDAYDEEQVGEKEMLFDYRLREGPATSRNAIELLRLMGFDSSLVENAHARADRYLETGLW